MENELSPFTFLLACPNMNVFHERVRGKDSGRV
ncbi:DUF2933 domain-containing protein [Dysgonomonas sp. GY617]|nr:DUF2933 domain-containing protein [Dysgonomonas sp. GY617]